MSKLVEEWRPVVGYEGLYEVSDWGRVRSVLRVVKCGNGKGSERIFGGKIIKFSYKKNGKYHRYYLHKKGEKNKWFSCHRLVAEAFIPNPDNKPCIDHIDGNPENNSVYNLRWATHQENSNNPITLQRLKEANSGDRNPMYGRCGENNPNFGKHLSNEIRQKISENNAKYWLGKHFSDETRKKISEAKQKMRKKVCQYTLDGILIKEYHSLTAAAKENGFSSGNICSCCNGKHEKMYGYKWKYSSQ